jgi:hypothetical protein
VPSSLVTWQLAYLISSRKCACQGKVPKLFGTDRIILLLQVRLLCGLAHFCDVDMVCDVHGQVRVCLCVLL